MTTVIISLPESLKEFLDHEVNAKGCGDISEYVRGLLRDAQIKQSDSRLEKLLVEGLTSGHDIPLTQDFWRELKAEAAAIHTEQQEAPTVRRAK
ncbi:MAG: type II toxin-antitoxin system ParD family antitoxin [Acidobacteriaceae bacterium]